MAVTHKRRPTAAPAPAPARVVVLSNKRAKPATRSATLHFTIAYWNVSTRDSFLVFSLPRLCTAMFCCQWLSVSSDQLLCITTGISSFAVRRESDYDPSRYLSSAVHSDDSDMSSASTLESTGLSQEQHVGIESFLTVRCVLHQCIVFAGLKNCIVRIMRVRYVQMMDHVQCPICLKLQQPKQVRCARSLSLSGLL